MVTTYLIMTISGPVLLLGERKEIVSVLLQLQTHLLF